ncbi:hypothetical protein N0V88_006000 [Collariella sp. IMI 366227]|nr:hypothetical protein N0V88_006000 [Collariella sp. IMI 366227]
MSADPNSIPLASLDVHADVAKDIQALLLPVKLLNERLWIFVMETVVIIPHQRFATAMNMSVEARQQYIRHFRAYFCKAYYYIKPQKRVQSNNAVRFNEGTDSRPDDDAFDVEYEAVLADSTTEEQSQLPEDFITLWRKPKLLTTQSAPLDEDNQDAEPQGPLQRNCRYQEEENVGNTQQEEEIEAVQPGLPTPKQIPEPRYHPMASMMLPPDIEPYNPLTTFMRRIKN